MEILLRRVGPAQAVGLHRCRVDQTLQEFTAAEQLKLTVG